MPRQSKPFLRKQTQSWYCSIGGKQISLGKDRESAFAKFHELMSDRESITSELVTLYDLSQSYLDWCKANRKSTTYDKHRLYLRSFIDHVGKQLKTARLKQHHITKWKDSNPNWSDNSANDAISIVQRMINWAVDEGYLHRTPIPKVKKPRRRRRDVVYTDAQWKEITIHARGPVLDLLNFLYLTGCRPIEARTLEAKHIHDDLIIFPADESKGETDPRVVFLTPEAKAIVDRLANADRQGPVFRNNRGNPWTKNAIKCAMTRITEKVGFRVIAYGTRHSYATNALTQGGVDPVSLAHLMGHKDAAMVSRVYSHIAKNPDYLRAQARKAILRRTEH
ncbi:tyrosine-type recombinase/integrase [Stieleria magnilauensis]|uniref:Site-specific tyrosine recombinase XerC n=1 Tax=Stieleria magnilauensis TaxID=2527963 RepID=A0ABX5XJ43_9BACT|nr:site-specific tyrosine recombinase XerC [Planctomycetes bacterium TBK1r]